MNSLSRRRFLKITGASFGAAAAVSSLSTVVKGAEKVEVKTGIQDNTSIEILEGLKEGDEVVVAPFNAINKTLKDSMQVKVVTEEELFKVK